MSSDILETVATAPMDAYATDYDSGDDLQPEISANGGIASSEVRRMQHTRESRESSCCDAIWAVLCGLPSHKQGLFVLYRLNTSFCRAEGPAIMGFRVDRHLRERSLSGSPTTWPATPDVRTYQRLVHSWNAIDNHVGHAAGAYFSSIHSRPGVANVAGIVSVAEVRAQAPALTHRKPPRGARRCLT